MKILVLFCDMLRANLLHTFNPEAEGPGPLDDWFDRLGGTAFTRCYTPAPDTGRGLTCLVTGLYPRNHGCTLRTHFPKHFLQPSIDTVFDPFLEQGYHITVRINANKERLGILPPNITPENKAVDVFNYLPETLDSIKRNWSTCADQCLFISLSDFHWALDDYGPNLESTLIGQEHLANAWRMIFDAVPMDELDYVLVFSDHGCKLDGDAERDNPLYLLNDDRAQIAMFLHRKGDTSVERCAALTSALDVYPTIYDALGVAPPRPSDGVSLLPLDGREGRFVVFEDSSRFKQRMDIYNDLWGVRTETHLFLEGLRDSALFSVEPDGGCRRIENPDSDLVRSLQATICEHSCHYAENKKLHEVLKYYRTWDTLKDRYSDGEGRHTRRSSRVTGLQRRIRMGLLRFAARLLRLGGALKQPDRKE